MKRRDLLGAAAAAALARPAIAQGAQARTLVFVPQANLTSLDPIWTTATVTRNFAFLVLRHAVRRRCEARPPRRRWSRAPWSRTTAGAGPCGCATGLLFHDGTPVLARDCVASLRRWMKRDALGKTLAARLDALEAPDDRTLVFRLNKQSPWLPFALAKTQPSPPVIMPERIAATDPFKQITEAVGSGPWRFVADEYVSGSLAVFASFDAYRPRDEPPDFTAGGKRALVDRIEWQIIPDQATAASALRSGEVDWMEIPLPDLIPHAARPTATWWWTGSTRTGCIRCCGPTTPIAPTDNRRCARPSWRRSTRWRWCSPSWATTRPPTTRRSAASCPAPTRPTTPAWTASAAGTRRPRCGPC